MPAAAAIGAAVIGAGGSIYGAQQNKKAAKEAEQANAAAVAAQNAANYQRWLESKGVSSTGQPINFKLPRYMTWNKAAVAGRNPNIFATPAPVVAKPSI